MKKISKQISEKVQGPTMKKESVPQKPETQDAQYRGRSGWGGFDSYAYAVKNVIDSAKDSLAHTKGFLGKESKMMNPKEFVDNKMLHKKKGKK
jgi:hypothetical protein